MLTKEDSKYDEIAAAKPQNTANWAWDLSVNSQQIGFSYDNRRATLKGRPCTVRSPFWKSGRHIVNIKIHIGGHIGIGIVDKEFNIGVGNWIGEDEHSYGTWDDSPAFHANDDLPVTNELTVKQGDIVTVDVDLDNHTLNWAINGQYLSIDDTVTGIPKHVALAASLWEKEESIEIIQYIQK
eukprot:153462_1